MPQVFAIVSAANVRSKLPTRGTGTLLAKKQFAEIVDEIVQQFTARVGSKVEILVELQASSPSGFDEGVQRTVRENCNTLRFKSFDFEVGD